jgi:hypothetical protein
MDYVSVYPPEQSDTYVKATSFQDAARVPYNATDPTKSLTGGETNGWVSHTPFYRFQRINIDLGSEKIVKRVYYENYHDSGGYTTAGGKDFVLYGSDSADAFSDTSYENNTDWDTLTTSVSALVRHTPSDIADPKYFTVTNTTAYRYYSISFSSNYDYGFQVGLRRIELQIEAVLNILNNNGLFTFHG